MRHVGTLWAKRSLLSTSRTSACSSAVRARAGVGRGTTGEGHTKWLVVELDACATDMFELSSRATATSSATAWHRATSQLILTKGQPLRLRRQAPPPASSPGSVGREHLPVPHRLHSQMGSTRTERCYWRKTDQARYIYSGQSRTRWHVAPVD